MTSSAFFRLFFPGALALAAGIGLLTACDEIDQPIPPKTVESAGRRDTVALDSAEAAYLELPGHSTPVQRVLLEDYTGHTCGNCPRAAEKAMELQQQYGERVVVVATHVGYFADTTKPGYHYDFRTAAGNELNQVFNVDNFGLPQGMVNRTPAAGAGQPVTTLGSWATIVANELARAPEQQLTVTGLREESNRTLRVKVTSKYLTAKPGTYRLVLNYIEDTLTRNQKDYSLPAPSDIPRYVHRHILRDSPLTTFGTIDAIAPTQGQVHATYLRYPLPDKPWATRPAHLVAYLIDDATKRIVQVAETEL
jgi:hypothetical protein